MAQEAYIGQLEHLLYGTHFRLSADVPHLVVLAANTIHFYSLRRKNLNSHNDLLLCV